MADPSIADWYRPATRLFQKFHGKTVVEIVCAGSVQNLGENCGDDGSYWGDAAERIYRIIVGSPDSHSPDATATSDGLLLLHQPPAEFLSAFDGQIDLLYLDGWPVYTARYHDRHLEAYRQAR